MKLSFGAALLALHAGASAAFAPVQPQASAVVARNMAGAASGEELYIDAERRFVMNLIMVGSGLVTVAGFGVPYIAFFFPPGSGGGSAGVSAKDALGNDIFAKDYLASKPANDRSLAQGLKGDAT
jgi:cytochrome b6-f complex iron-sulfur subunit